MPGEVEAKDPSTAKMIAEYVLNKISKEKIAFTDFLTWGTTETLPENIRRSIKPGGTIKQDLFINGLEELVSEKKAYNRVILLLHGFWFILSQDFMRSIQCFLKVKSQP